MAPIQPKSKVVLWEPEKTIASKLEKLIASWGADLIVTHNTKEAIDTCEKQQADLLIVDFFLPDSSAIDIAQAIKFEKRLSQTAILALVTTNEWLDLLKMYQAGIDATLQLPLKKERFIKMMDLVHQEKNRYLQMEVIGNWIDFELSSSHVLLQSTSQFISTMLTRTKLNNDEIQGLGFALNEFLLNGIEHGNQYDLRKHLKISYVVFDDKVVIKIADEGQGFKPKNLIDPIAKPQEVAEIRMQSGKRPGGYGIAVSRQFVDSLEYNDQGNVLIMSKDFARKKEDEQLFST